VGCLGDTLNDAIRVAMLSVGYKIPVKGVLMSSGTLRDKVVLLESCRMIAEKGITIYATGGSREFLSANGVEAQMVHWPDKAQKPNALDLLREREIDLVINIPKNLSKNELHNDYIIRRAAIDHNIPLITNARLAAAFISSVFTNQDLAKDIKAWNDY